MTATKTDFLPQGYTIPSTSQYMKLENGVNTFRVLGKPIMGMEFWTSKIDDKGQAKRVPNRRRMGEIIKMSELEINPDSGKIDSPQHFWAMPVWNYKDKCIQVLELKQKSVLEALLSYIENPKWGSPTEYDITINKSGEKLLTKYLVDHDPKEPISAEIAQMFADTYLNLEVLFDGEDPFKLPTGDELENAINSMDA